MKNKNGYFSMAAAALAMGAGERLMASEPPDMVIRYLIRELPSDPDSDLVFEFILHLQPAETDGSSVGWKVAEAEFAQYGPTGTLDVTWIADWPVIDTPDGLWWVDHDDPLNPLRGEFNAPPLLQGTADAADPSTADLDYSLQGEAYTGTPGFYGSDVSSLTYSVTLRGAQEPEEEGEDEPAEIDEGEDPS